MKKTLICISTFMLSICFIISMIYISRMFDSVSAREKTKVVLDAGHGGYDSGCISSTGVYEKDITLSVTMFVGSYLQDAGYDVVYTRTSDEVSWPDDVSKDLKERVNIATLAQGDVFVSIHLNSSDEQDGAFGIEAYYNGVDTNMESLAQSILNELDTLEYSDDRGVKSTFDNPLYVIDQNNIPAVLIELGFLSDYEDANYLCDTSNQKKIAEKIAQAIMSQYQVEKDTM